MKVKIKSVGFWSGLIASVFLILSAFGVEIGDAAANAVINGVCSLLVVLGIAAPPKSVIENIADCADDEPDSSVDIQ